MNSEKRKEIYDNSTSELMEGSAIYFQFEEDFMEEGIRCIPMIVRFKLDACGIKLKLSEWSKMKFEEKNKLCKLEGTTNFEIQQYRGFLKQIVFEHTRQEATELIIDNNPEWMNVSQVPCPLQEELKKYNWKISLLQWKSLSILKRFVLMKLSKPGHENKNFPKAVKEFGLV